MKEKGLNVERVGEKGSKVILRIAGAERRGNPQV